MSMRLLWSALLLAAATASAAETPLSGARIRSQPAPAAVSRVPAARAQLSASLAAARTSLEGVRSLREASACATPTDRVTCSALITQLDRALADVSRARDAFQEVERASCAEAPKAGKPSSSECARLASTLRRADAALEEARRTRQAVTPVASAAAASTSRRQSSFQSIDQKVNQLLQILASVVKTMNESATGPGLRQAL